MASPIKVYQYDKCGTCRKALKFLDARKVPYVKVSIVDQPPGKAELREMVGKLGGDFRRLFNTSGVEYRRLGLSSKAAGMSAGEAVELLAGNGRLVKRPFVLAGKTALVGFREEEWGRAFA